MKRIWLSICIIVLILFVPLIFGALGITLLGVCNIQVISPFDHIGVATWWFGIGVVCTILLLIMFIYWIFTGKYIFNGKK